MSNYLTFPIALLKVSEIDIKQIIDEAFDYCLYEHCLLHGIEIDNIEQAENDLNIKYPNKQGSYYSGLTLFEQVNATPKTSIRADTLFDFYGNTKTEDEINSFLAFMAVRSIIQKDACKKVTNEYLLSRMAGYAKKESKLPPRLEKFKSRYWIDKLKKDLQLNWGLKLYGRHTRGAYMSFKMTQKELTYYAETRRNQYRQKKLTKENELIRLEVLESLKLSASNLR